MTTVLASEMLPDLLARSLEKAFAQTLQLEKDYELLSGSEAIREYGVSRTDLRYIAPTRRPGCSKPAFLRRNIRIYLDRHTEPAPRKKTKQQSTHNENENEQKNTHP